MAKFDAHLKCSFCGKSQDQVRKLIAGPGVYICDECIDLCNEILDEELVDSQGNPRQGAEAARKAAPAASEIKIANAGDYPGSQPHGTKKPRAGGANNLTRVKGIGPANEKKLNALGIWHFDQIAAWKKAEVQWVGSYLAFPGRIEREEWVKQAKVLAKGGETEFSKRVDKGQVATSVPGKRGAQPKKKTTAKGGKA